MNQGTWSPVPFLWLPVSSFAEQNNSSGLLPLWNTFIAIVCFADEDTEAQRGQVTCPGSHSRDLSLSDSGSTLAFVALRLCRLLGMRLGRCGRGRNG